MSYDNQKGPTLLELLIVLIVISILAAVAFPKLYSIIEASRSQEAFNTITVIRNGLEHCYLSNGGTYQNCAINDFLIDDPNNNPGSHFVYSFADLSQDGFTIRAVRNTLDKGNPADIIEVTQGPGGIVRSGTGAFQGIK